VRLLRFSIAVLTVGLLSRATVNAAPQNAATHFEKQVRLA
jgi:hypothetical protein